MSGLAVLSAPGIPEGWHRREVVRIIDPLGLVAAWIAPGLAGACIGLSSRKATEHPWRTVLASDPDGDRLGCEVTCTKENDQPAPLRCVASSSELYERDPTRVTVLVRLLGRDFFVWSRCDEQALGFGWSWPDSEPGVSGFHCLGYSLAPNQEIPVSVSKHVEVNAIHLTIRCANASN